MLIDIDINLISSTGVDSFGQSQFGLRLLFGGRVCREDFPIFLTLLFIIFQKGFRLSRHIVFPRRCKLFIGHEE